MHCIVIFVCVLWKLKCVLLPCKIPKINGEGRGGERRGGTLEIAVKIIRVEKDD